MNTSNEKSVEAEQIPPSSSGPGVETVESSSTAPENTPTEASAEAPEPAATNGTAAEPNDAPEASASTGSESTGEAADASEPANATQPAEASQPAQAEASAPAVELADGAAGDAGQSEGAESATETASGEEGPDLKLGKPELPAEEMSFAEMFELAEKQSKEKRKKLKAAIGSDLRPGQIVFARVVGTSHDSVFLDVGAKAEGVIPRAELLDENGELPVKEGDKVEARIRKIEGGTVQLSTVPAHQSLKRREELKEAHRAQIPVEGRVTSTNKGGFDVEVAGVRAFCPASQIDLRPGKGEAYVGQKFPFRIVEFKDGGRNIVVSRRQILQEERDKKAQEILASLEEGAVRTGTVTSVRDYGAFVDLGGLEGLVHLTEITHGHINKPQQALKPGNEVEVKILKIEDGKNNQKKISLSIKALQQDPWELAREKIKEGDKVTGKVARIQAFGAFVELMPGVDGLIHISNMTLDRKAKNPRDIVKEGDEVEARVIATDWGKRRIGLSMVKTPQELANELKQGIVVEGKVDRLEDFGVFVKLESGARGLVPARETGTGQGTDLKKAFNLGDPVRVLVQEVDRKSGRIRMSIRAAREADERAEYAGFINKDPTQGKGLGTLGDLLAGQLGKLRDNLGE